jgi:hypothetical protein
VFRTRRARYAITDLTGANYRVEPNPDFHPAYVLVLLTKAGYTIRLGEVDGTKNRDRVLSAVNRMLERPTGA